MNIKTFHNTRGETASTDGKRWWSGADSDEATIVLNELQPVSELFQCPPEDLATVVKARSVFISALRKTAPTVKPDNYLENAVLRDAWDDATDFASSHDIIAAGQPVFDCKQMLVGTADAIVRTEDGVHNYTYCYAPNGYRWRGEMNAVVRILSNGLPIDCCDDPFGTYTLRELARAISAVATSRETSWYVNHRACQPF